MIRFSLTGSILVVALLVATSMYTLNVALETPISSRTRLLFVGCGTGEYWQRMAAGARDAARELGVELEIQMPTPEDLVDQQSSIVRRINTAGYDGVAISPADSETQVELINDLARQTKLVTIDRDAYNSRRLCHIGYRQANAGRLAARLACDQLSGSGKIAILATTFLDDVRNSSVSERLAGFKEAWGTCGPDSAMPCPIIQIATDSDFSETLADPELAIIVALDSKAAECALKTLPANETRHVPIIAFDPGQAIFDAIDDGRVCSAIYSDPYRSGFTAIHRLGAYCGEDKDFLPVPGLGSDFIVSEVVRKKNLADFRPRTRS